MIVVVDRAGRTREVKHKIDWTAVKWLANVDFAKFKARIILEMCKIGEASSQQVVDGDDGVAFTQKGIAQVRTKEASSACYQRSSLSHAFLVAPCGLLDARVDWLSARAGSRPTL